MNSGKYVFSQLLQFINRYEFEKCVTRYDGNHRTRGLNCWNQFLHLFFGQLTSRNSLRDIRTCLKAHQNKLYHLGIKQYLNQSTLSGANENRERNRPVYMEVPTGKWYYKQQTGSVIWWAGGEIHVKPLWGPNVYLA